MLSFLPFLIRDRGFLTLAYDYNLQQIPFAAAVYEGIKQLPAGQWVWNLDLGSSLISGFGFYNLGSPFFKRLFHAAHIFAERGTAGTELVV